MMIYGIDVIMVVPGPVATAIWEKGEATDLSAYENTIYGPIVEHFRRYMIEDGRKGLKPQCLGEIVHVALTARRPKTSYAVIPKRFKNWTSAEEDARHVNRKTAGPETDTSANLGCMVSKIFVCPMARSCWR
jgi:hypothetical protein